ncbi:MAG: hypothetical protein LBN10_03610 [Propionibacteriaceae bacterium]|nr:hypothetical protein [Propionibacteriaceae bacterium]
MQAAYGLAVVVVNENGAVGLLVADEDASVRDFGSNNRPDDAESLAFFQCGLDVGLADFLGFLLLL